MLNSCYASLYADDTVICCYGTSSKELSDILGVAKWLHDHKLTLKRQSHELRMRDFLPLEHSRSNFSPLEVWIRR